MKTANITAAAAALGVAIGLASGGARAQLDDKSAMAIMNKAACSACHTIDKRSVGPSYKDVAAKRKGEKDAAAVMAEKIRKGSTGVYGPIPMPPNPADKVSDDQVKQMVAWILTK